MDVKSLLNHDDQDECTPRPRIHRFAPFTPQPSVALQPHKAAPSTSSSRQPLPPSSPPHGHSRPLLGHPSSPSSSRTTSSSCRPQLSSPKSRAASYCSVSSTTSSASSSSSPSSQQQQYHHGLSLPPPLTPATPLSALSPGGFSLPSLSRLSCSEQLPSIATQVPSLARSDSGDSDSIHSPTTPEQTPSSTLPFSQRESVSVPSKHISYAARSLPRPQLLSYTSSSSTTTTGVGASGPPSSMDSFPHTPGNGYGGEVSFAPPPMPLPPPPFFNPNLPPSVLPEQQHEPHQPVNPASAAPKPGMKKNSYPCPLARQFHCTEFFTTSGHAARHAKKHTGKKDAICPECNKAFTRKDNMEQHRRTHSKDTSAATRSSSRANSDKDDNNTQRRKMAKLGQHGKRQRHASMSSATATVPSTSLSGSNPANAISSPSVSSTLSPTAENPAPPTSLTNSQSAPSQLSMDMALDPRLRDGSLPNGSNAVTDFSPAQTPVFPSAFSVPNTPQTNFASSNFNTVMSPSSTHQPPFTFHHQRVNSMSMAPPLQVGMNNSMMSQSPQSAPAVDTSFPGSLDYMSLGPIGLGVNMTPASSVDLGVPTGMTAMGANTLAMSMTSPIGMRDPHMDMCNGLAVTPAMDRLALDKLAMAAEAASGDRRTS